MACGSPDHSKTFPGRGQGMALRLPRPQPLPQSGSRAKAVSLALCTALLKPQGNGGSLAAEAKPAESHFPSLLIALQNLACPSWCPSFSSSPSPFSASQGQRHRDTALQGLACLSK